MKQKRAERREQCKQNPAKCQELREQRKQRRAEMKARCDADPARCEQMKQEMREKFWKEQGSESPPAD